MTLLLCACAASSGPLAPPIAPGSSAAPFVASRAAVATSTIVTFGADERDRLVYEPLIAQFNRDNPDLFVQFVPLDATARLGSSQPAIVARSMRAIAAGADAFALQFARAEHSASPLLRDLLPLIDADATFDRADFYPAALPAGGAVRVVPLRIEVPLLAYNKDRWDAAGLPAPQPAWSWRELLGAAEQLSGDRAAGDDTVGLLNDFDGRSAVVALLGELQAANIAPGDNARRDQPALGPAFERIVSLVQNHTLGRPLTPQQLNAEDVQPLLRDANAVLWPAARWPTHMGELPYATGVAAYPPGPLPQPRQVNGVAISSGTQHATEAWRWLSWLSRQNVDAPAGTALNDYTLPARKSVAEASGLWNSFDTEATAALETTLARPAAADERAAQALAAALTDALLAVTEDGEAADVALQRAQGTLELELAELGKPAAAAEPISVATPAPTPAVPITRIRFEPGMLNGWAIPEVVQQFNREHQDIQVSLVQPAPNAEWGVDAAAERSDCFVDFRPFSFDQPMNVAGVRDLQPMLDADAAFPRDDYLPGVWEPFKHDGKLLAIPYDVRFVVLGYNKTLFDAAGQEYPRGDWTLDDFLQAADRLTYGDGDERVFGFGEPQGNAGVDLLVTQAGASLVVGDGDSLQPNFTDPKVLQGIQRYIDLLRNFSPQQRMMNFDDAQLRRAHELRNQGRVAMWFDADRPRNWVGLDPSITLAMAPLPLGSFSPSPFDWWLTGFYISAQSPYPEACWTFHTFLSQNLMALTQHGWPTRISVGESSEFTTADPDGAEIWRAYRQAMDRPAVSSAQASWTNDVDPSYGQYWFQRALDRALQGKPLDRELADAQFWTEQYLACTRGGEEGESCAKQVDPSYEGYPKQ